MRFRIIIAVLLSAASLRAGEPVDATFQRLAKVDVFAFGPTGYAGTTSQGEKDYKVVLSHPTALDDFERLLAVGNPQARSYALVGIYALKSKHSKELSTPLRASKEEVVTESGCIVSHEFLGAVIKRIEAGEYSKEKQQSRVDVSRR